MYSIRPLFKQHGLNFIFDPFDQFSYKTISVGDDVFIGSGANFAASETFISIGSKVMFGPNVTIMGGNHNTSVIGAYMYDVKVKLPENDQPVIIEDDVWVGTGVIILKGVTIGKGSIIAAGSVVTKSCKPYSILGGIPAKLLKSRFTEEEINRHEQMINKF
ncbi:MAG TPA: CatB-related O-acetyltransferase [Saprospiraceae bacterium]|nr:CatB-related O-acetyltransferase [Saprospiraceae bacterium]